MTPTQRKARKQALAAAKLERQREDRAVAAFGQRSADLLAKTIAANTQPDRWLTVDGRQF